MITLVFSTKDPASMLMFDIMSEHFKASEKEWEGMAVFVRDNIELLRTNSELVFFNQVNDIDTDEIIFMSRHKSASAKPTITAHFCGNFGPADLGGEPGKLSTADALLMQQVFKELLGCFLDYDVSLEVTHHGPLVKIPHFWVELGSSEKQWNDSEAAEFIVNSVLKALEKKPESKQVGIGIGGGHYAPVFSKIEEETPLGHIMPKYAQEYLSKEMLVQMIEKTFPEPKVIFIDKKGVRQQSTVKKLAEETGLEVIVV